MLAAYYEVDAEILKTALSLRNADVYRAFVLESTTGLASAEAYECCENLTTTCAKSVCNGDSGSSALLRNSVSRRAIYVAALTGQAEILEMVTNVGKRDTDTLLAALEFMPHAWRTATTVQALKGHCEVYITAVASSESSDVRSVALTNLADVVDRIFSFEKPILWLTDKLSGLGSLLHSHSGNPQLSNAEIRISGSILLYEYLQEQDEPEPLKQRLEAWGVMISAAGNASNVRNLSLS